MNQAEIWTAVLAATAIFVAGRPRRHGWLQALAGALFCLPFLGIALVYCSQFLTVDEYGVLDALLGEGRAGIIQAQLQASALRTSLALYGPIFWAGDLSAWSDGAVQVFKLTHWGMGLLTFLAVAHAARRLAGVATPLFAAVLLSLLLCCPTNLSALKTFNYDLLALTLGVLALLLIALALRHNSPRQALVAVVCGYLAAQEKLIASPVLLAALVTFAHVRQMAAPRRRLGWLVLDVGGACAVGLALGLVCHYVIALCFGLSLPSPLLAARQASYPLVSFAWPALRFLGTVTEFDAYTIPVAVATLLLLTGTAALLTVARRRLPAAPPGLVRLEAAAVVVLAVGIVVGAVAAATWIEPYWAPYEPIAASHYQPGGEINGATLHFGAVTHLGHMGCHIAYVYCVFVFAAPTVLWGAAVVAGAAAGAEAGIFRRLMLLGLLPPAALGLCNINVGNRYLNLFLCLFALGAACTAWLALRRLPRPWAIGLLLLLPVGAALEVAPFEPLAAAFRPCWVQYRGAALPLAGHMNPSWVGWGEETLLAGLRMQKALANDPGPIRLGLRYPGHWVRPDPRFRQIELWKGPPAGDIGFTDHDYYLLNRSCVVQGVPWPADVKPDFVISYRGFAMAWIYRGDKLHEAGYVYEPTVQFFTRDSE